MKFFFPDSQDQIDPDFDFMSEEKGIFRVRQRDDLYAHETLRTPPFDGLLVSKAIVDGAPRSAGKYTTAQRHRLHRQGARQFFRLPRATHDIPIMGDCGAFNYIRDDIPPYSVDAVIDFYQECGFDLGVSVDHVILGYTSEEKESTDAGHLAQWRRRQEITLELAVEFLDSCRYRGVGFEPVGVAQGWSPSSYARSVQELQRMGYRRIAVGGMVALKTPAITRCLDAIDDIRDPATQLHLLGISRCDSTTGFAARGVTSFDTTAPFQQAFKDDRDNYYAPHRSYVAVRVPQVDGNPKLRKAIRAGRIPQDIAIAQEQNCLRLLRSYAMNEVSLDAVVSALREYEDLYDPGGDRSDDYRETLADRPWQRCWCGICDRIGIEVVLFRGAERNKRRGFHNLHVFRTRLAKEEIGGTR